MANPENCKNENGEFIAYAWPGGYPIIYLDRENNTLCPTCANKCPDEVIAGHVYWEGPAMTCAECNAELKSAYGDPSEDSAEN